LISIDHFLNEALYKNIIQQSQNPDDQNLHKEYNVIYSMSKKSNFASLFNENDMDNTDENINNINNNLRTI